MRNIPKNVIVFMLFLTCSLMGCVSIPLGEGNWSVFDGDHPIYDKEIDVIQFNGCHFEVSYEDGYSGHKLAYCTLWADGQFNVKTIKTDQYSVPKRIAFGICPGILVPHPSELYSEYEDTNPAGVFIENCFWSCLLFPLIDAIIFEPFAGFRHNINRNNMAQNSIFGFCKYWEMEKYREVSPFKEIHSEVVSKVRIYDCKVTFGSSSAVQFPKKSKNGGILIIDDTPSYNSIRQTTIKIYEIGKVRGNIQEYLKEFNGASFVVDY